MINFMMTVNRYCMECIKEGEFLPLQFVMMNLKSGMWLCPKKECAFPMNSSLLNDYIEDNISSEKALILTSKKKQIKKKKKRDSSVLTVDNVHRTSQHASQSCLTTSVGSLASSTTTTIAGSTGSSTSEKSFKCGPEYVKKYPLWENKDLLCWLDTALSLLVLNTSFQKHFSEEKKQCFLSLIYEEYSKVQSIYQVKKLYNHVRKQLEEIRYDALEYLKTKLLTKCNEEDSPLFSLPLLLKTDTKLYEKLEVNYRSQFKCQKCQFEKFNSFQKVVITLPNTSTELNFNDNIFFKRACFRCNNADQVNKIFIEKYPPVLFFHFPQGVHNQAYWKELSFSTSSGDEYMVTQVIQYLNKRRHFLLWSFSYSEKLWLCADDLNDPVAEYKFTVPQCPASEVHILVWEKVENLSFQKFAREQFSDNLQNLSISGGYPSASSSIDGLSPLGSPCQAKNSSIKNLMYDKRYKPYVSRMKSEVLTTKSTVSETVKTLSEKNIDNRSKVNDSFPVFDNKSVVISNNPDIQNKKTFIPSLDGILERVNTVLDGDFDELYNDVLTESSNNHKAHFDVRMDDLSELEMFLS